MEKISFRVWDRDLKRFTSGTGVRMEYQAGGSIESGNGFDLMLGSGIPDRNGKEIFEGDVVWSRHSHDFGFIRLGKYKADDGLWQYGFYSLNYGSVADNDGDDVDDDNGACGLFDVKDEVWCEVIGTVYDKWSDLKKISNELTEKHKIEMKRGKE